MKQLNHFCSHVLLFLVLVSFASCNPDFKEPNYSSGEANFSRTIAIGGDFLSGYQDGALFVDGQLNSVSAMLTEQFKTVGGGNFTQALMPDYSGIGLSLTPWRNKHQRRSSLGYVTDCKGDRTLFPIQDSLGWAASELYVNRISPSGITDFSIPFASITDYSNPKFGLNYPEEGSNLFYSRFSSNPGTSTVLNDARRINPTFFIGWFGVEDVYKFALGGAANGSMPTSSEFGLALDQLLSELTANGTSGIIANIPDIESFPFFTTVSPMSLNLDAVKADSLNLLAAGTVVFIAGDNGFLIEDKTIPAGARLMTKNEMVLLDAPLDSIKCNFVGSLALLPDAYTLDKMEIQLITDQIAIYNDLIQVKASKYNIPVVDMNSFFRKVKDGFYSEGVHYTSEFIKGGFFSLDGFHPNQKGYGLIANEFIKRINSHYKSNIPETNCKSCIGIRFP